MKKGIPIAIPGNRRHRQGASSQHYLDVKVRTVTARRQRRERMEGLVWKIALLVSLCAAAWIGTTAALDKFFFSNPEYTLKRVSLALDGVMTREDALAETGIHEGDNIFRIDLAGAEKALRAIPQVATVLIERQLPDHIAITLTARNPVAWVAPLEKDADPFDPERSLLVDDTGYLMKPRMIQPDYYHLPVIFGVRSENIRDGEPLHNEDLRRALTLLDDIVRNPDSLIHVQSMNISKGFCIEVNTERNAKVIFAPEDFSGQLARLRRLLEHCNESGRELESVNLMVRRNTPVTFVIATASKTTAEPARGKSAINSKEKRN